MAGYKNLKSFCFCLCIYLFVVKETAAEMEKKICILLFGQQSPPKIEKQLKQLVVNTEKEQWIYTFTIWLIIHHFCRNISYTFHLKHETR